MDPTMDWRMQVLGALATALIAVITACVPVLVRAAVQYLQRRLHLQVTDAQRWALQLEAERAVAFVEEQSRKALAARGVPIASPDKLTMAKQVLRDAMLRGGFDELASAGADMLLQQAIESHLGMGRSRVPAPTGGNTGTQ